MPLRIIRNDLLKMDVDAKILYALAHLPIIPESISLISARMLKRLKINYWSLLSRMQGRKLSS